MKEVWKDVKGYEGLYQVSSEGRVVSNKRPGTSGGMKKLTENQDGYLRVKLCKDSDNRRYMVHRLVYEAFVGPIPDGLEINHIDENKKNNSIQNLEAVSHLENINHGTGAKRCAEAHHKPVRQYTMDGEFVAEYPSRNAATEATGIRGSGISLCAHGKNSHAGGYIWKLANVR